MKQSRFLEAFKAVKELCADDYVLYGDALLVEEVPEEEVETKSGLILSTGDKKMVDGVEANKPCFVRVVAIGAGFTDEDSGEDVPLDVAEGDIVLVGKLSVSWLSTFGRIFTHEGQQRLGLTRESEIKLRLKGEAGYNAVMDLLKEKVYGNGQV